MHTCAFCGLPKSEHAAPPSAQARCLYLSDQHAVLTELDPEIIDEHGITVRTSTLAARYRREMIERKAWRFASRRR